MPSWRRILGKVGIGFERRIAFDCFTSQVPAGVSHLGGVPLGFEKFTKGRFARRLFSGGKSCPRQSASPELRARR